jgi:hypothetical protein
MSRSAPFEETERQSVMYDGLPDIQHSKIMASKNPTEIACDAGTIRTGQVDQVDFGQGLLRQRIGGKDPRKRQRCKRKTA